MSKRTFKKRKNCLHLSFVNYKFINLSIFTPPLFHKSSHFAILFYFDCKDTSFPFSTYAICAICVDSGNKVRKNHGIIQKNISEGYEIISER